MTTSALITMITIQLLITGAAVMFMVKVLRKKHHGKKNNGNLKHQ